MNKKKKPAKPEYPKVIELFGVPWGIDTLAAGHTEPSYFNGVVTVERYRVTVEKLEEPVEVIQERIRQLWRSLTTHNIWPLREAGYADNPSDSDTSWNRDGGVDTTEPDQFVSHDPSRRVLVKYAVYAVTMPDALGRLHSSIAQWLLETFDAVTIDSMYRLATNYVQTVTELYNERTNK